MVIFNKLKIIFNMSKYHTSANIMVTFSSIIIQFMRMLLWILIGDKKDSHRIIAGYGKLRCSKICIWPRNRTLFSHASRLKHNVRCNGSTQKINEPFFVFILHNTPQTFCEQNFLKQFYKIVILYFVFVINRKGHAIHILFRNSNNHNSFIS